MMYSKGTAGWKSGVLLLFIHIGISRSHDLGDKIIDYRHHQQQGSVQTQLSYLRTQLGTVMEWIVNVDRQLTALDHRITDLQHRVTSLDQGVGGPEQPRGQSDLGVKWEEQLNDAGIHMKPSAMQQQGLMQYRDTPFTLRAVKKRDTGHVYIVTLHYQSSTAPDVLLKIGAYPVQVRDADLGVATVYIPKPEENSPEPWVYFVFPEYFVSVRLNLFSSSEISVPLVSLKIAQGNDVVFQSGHDAQMNFEFHVEDDVKSVKSASAYVQFLTKSDEKEDSVDRLRLFFLNSEHTNSAGNVRLDLAHMEGSQGNWKGVAVINSSNADTEGIMEAFITLNFNCSVNCLVKQMTKQYHVRVHRADHQDPFPQGFIGFVRDDYKQNATHVLCDLNPYAKPCAILCEAAGSRVTSVQIQKVGSPGVDSSRLLTAGKGGYWGTAMMTFERLRMEDGGEYVCTARSGDREISERVTLMVQHRMED